MTVLSVDPGQNIGIAVWDDDGTLLDATEVKIDAFLAYLAAAPAHKTVVVESWKLRTRQMQQTGSKMEASQMIGAVRLYCKLFGAELVMQDPAVMRITAMHFDIKLPKGHIPDRTAAMLHGYRYFEERGILKPLLQQ